MSSLFRTFEDINAWKESRHLVREIRNICKRPIVQKDFAFIDQITRAARSISANIAEGNDAMSRPSFVTFLSYAKRSAAEVRSHLYDALDENYISYEEFLQLSDRAEKIAKMISKLITHLRSHV